MSRPCIALLIVLIPGAAWIPAVLVQSTSSSPEVAEKARPKVAQSASLAAVASRKPQPAINLDPVEEQEPPRPPALSRLLALADVADTLDPPAEPGPMNLPSALDDKPAAATPPALDTTAPPLPDDTASPLATIPHENAAPVPAPTEVAEPEPVMPDLPAPWPTQPAMRVIEPTPEIILLGGEPPLATPVTRTPLPLPMAGPVASTVAPTVAPTSPYAIGTVTTTPQVAPSSTTGSARPMQSPAPQTLPDPGAPPVQAPAVPGKATPPQTVPEVTAPPLETLPEPRPLPPTRLGPVVTPSWVNGADLGIPAGPPSSGRVTLDAEAVLWTITNRRTPVTVGAPSLTTTGSGDTTGAEHLDRHATPGARLGLGYWWTEENPWVPGRQLITGGVEASFFFLGQRSINGSDTGSSTLVRPFFDLNDATMSSLLIAAPGIANGALFTSASEKLWGGEANVWRTIHANFPGTTGSVEAMVGVRYVDLTGNVQINTDTTYAKVIATPAYVAFAGDNITAQESFGTHNRFYGGQAGLRGNLFMDTFVFTGTVKLALGYTDEQLDIEGSQRRILPNGTSTLSPGVLDALPSNIGTHNQYKFGYVPEFDLKMAYPVNRFLTMSMSFSAMYWSRVIRPEDQIDGTADIRQIPNFPGATTAIPTGLNRPGVLFNQSDLWLFGVMVSAEVHW